MSKRKILLLVMAFLLAIGAFNTLDWIFNTPLKAWEYLEIMPKTYLLVWNAYILAQLCWLFYGITLYLYAKQEG